MQEVGNAIDQAGAYAPVAGFKILLAKQIAAILDDENLSSKDAQTLTGIDKSEFSRLRNARTERFTIDRLVVVLGVLGFGVELRAEIVQSRSVARPQSIVEEHA